jgi:hypothetical protein
MFGIFEDSSITWIILKELPRIRSPSIGKRIRANPKWVHLWHSSAQEGLLTKRSSHRIGTAILAATLFATLTGCTPQASTPTAPKPTHSSSTVATPKPTKAPVSLTAETVTIGQALTADETLTMKRSYSDLLDAGKLVYVFPDGSGTILGMKDPVPLSVVADSNVKIAAAVAVSVAANDVYNNAVSDAIKVIQHNIGKRIVLVARVHTGDDAGNTVIWRWIAAVPGIDPHFFPNHDAAAAWASSYAASQNDPTAWAVIS